MTENLAKMPVKGILRKSSLTFIEHDEGDLQYKLESEKQTRVIVEPAAVPPREKHVPETVDEKIRRDEFELKRKMLQHQEAMTAQMAKKILSDDNIEEEVEANQEESMPEEETNARMPEQEEEGTDARKEDIAAETKEPTDEENMKTD